MERNKKMFTFDSEVAQIVSTDAAVVFQNILYWVEKNYANKKNFYDGDYWTYNSAEAFSKLFPFLTKRQIERILKELRENDLIKTGNYNEHKYDKTLWYALTEKGKGFSSIMCDPIRKCVDGDTQMCEPIPYVNTNIKTDIYSATKSRQKKICFGEHKNVFLTEEEHKKLVERFGEVETLKWIDKVSWYVAKTGVKYKSHYFTILDWHRKEEKVPLKEEKKSSIDEIRWD